MLIVGSEGNRYTSKGSVMLLVPNLGWCLVAEGVGFGAFWLPPDILGRSAGRRAIRNGGSAKALLAWLPGGRSAALAGPETPWRGDIEPTEAKQQMRQVDATFQVLKQIPSLAITAIMRR